MRRSARARQQAGCTRLEALLAGFVALLVDDVVKARARQVGVRERVKGAPLAVDRHLRVGGQAQVLRSDVSKPITESAPKEG